VWRLWLLRRKTTPDVADAWAPARQASRGVSEVTRPIELVDYDAVRPLSAWDKFSHDTAPVSGNGPFSSTGPYGHRRRMRERLIERGPEGLADYELLEMLLFFAFKQGDTKPLAKTLINRFGSYAAVLAAPQEDLFKVRGLGTHSVSAIKLVQASALRLARAEIMEQPVLNNWDRLMDYLTAAMAREKVEQFRALFLDSRNRLLADEVMGTGSVRG
jgi:DNA repair protein RadC